MSDPADVHCYALRRINPFLGVEQVLEMPQARAKSTNGVVWQLELLAMMPPEWGSLNLVDEPNWNWYLQARWSERDGLVNFPRVALDPGLDVQRLCEALVEVIRDKSDSLPFALRDNRELWLLDAAQKRPLALLYSMPQDAEPPPYRLYRWHGSRSGVSTPGQRQFPDVMRLEAAVKKRAGFNASTLWVNWDASHSQAVTGDGCLIDFPEFPLFGLREDWPDEQDASLVSRYIEWLAPSLLTLPYLPDEQRMRLESSLMKQTSSIEYHWRLYPKVLDKTKLDAARVASRLQSGVVR
ncbi:MAG: hypothetical protein PVG22_08170 [Chromatiales bacterium]